MSTYPLALSLARARACYHDRMTVAAQGSSGAGRPLKFQNAKHLRKRIEAYFRECDRQEDTRVFAHAGELLQEIPEIQKGKRVLKKRIVCSKCLQDLWQPGCILVSGELKLRKPYTVTGLAVWLDTSRQTLLNYECRPEFFDTIKRAKQRIESYAEEKLYDKDYPTKGVIFSLSNNHERWAERIETTVQDDRDPVRDLAEALFAAAGKSPDATADAPAHPDAAAEGSVPPGSEPALSAVHGEGNGAAALSVPAAG
jgi:DNA-packaging protein gp3